MLTEYALMPDIFDSSGYSSPEVCSIRMEYIKDVVLQEGLVRDLRNGEWRRYLAAKKDEDCWPSRSRELFKKLVKQNRLRPVPSVSDKPPSDAISWCHEAVASHAKDPLNGIITTQSVAAEFASTNIVSPIDKIYSATWWQDRSPSVRLHRKTDDYLRHLKLVFAQANSIMFIDPYIDPVKHNYREFYKLLVACRRELPPEIEIHLCHLDGIKPSQYKEDFERELSKTIQEAGLTVKVFIWNKFHDRYLISNVIGIKLSNGFDISKNSDEMTTWGRLGRDDRDDIQREFDPASQPNQRPYQFTVS
ncbi:MAG TPA: hypothetical protein IGS52_04120 [Oscillatoriaceae cyanobacterium M33_DOE_052]|uniref:MITD1 C-terminal phospholipase D-like domain-containing protein n=1 Tax=Planktothricoides sp. SpSt-374 TaxID=2282167 RepID=A0A7C3VLJ1_9CYAN|nr:hypothetical protein [Oscillatoriaceae cyanobacterium M33_DOE_052]